MSKTGLIIEREYVSRVKKPSFIIMTFVGPLLFAALMFVPAWLAIRDTDQKVIAVADGTQGLVAKMKSDKKMEFIKASDLKAALTEMAKEDSRYDGVLQIPADQITNFKAESNLFTAKTQGFELESRVQDRLTDAVSQTRLQTRGISEDSIKALSADVTVNGKVMNGEEEKESSSGIASAIGYAGGFIIYFFIFLYGVQVMRGVIEEKSNRIVEVIVTSVKPFELMMGKIIGIAMVGLTQVLLWVILTFAVVTGLGFIMQDKLSEKPATNTEVVKKDKTDEQFEKMQSQAQPIKKEAITQALYSKLDQYNAPYLFAIFLCYFIGGYILYAALFAVIGSAVDNETDTQQFMLPVTIPLILAIIMAQFVIRDPESSLAFWFSMVPLTSPIIMMVRLPFDVPIWQVALSIAILIATFIGTVWVAGRIYRVGILSYGKKASLKDLWLWLRA